MSELRTQEVQRALVDALKQNLPGVEVQAITTKEFDEQGNIIVAPPAILVLFVRREMDRGRDHVALMYESRHRFLLLCGVSAMANVADESDEAVKLTDQVAALLAGARLTLADATQRPLVMLAGVELWEFEKQGTWYAVEIVVEGVAQFGGALAA